MSLRVPKAFGTKQSHYEIPRGVYPEQKNEILRSAQNDSRRAWNDKEVNLFS
jgi:hypothetical protein